MTRIPRRGLKDLLTKRRRVAQGPRRSFLSLSLFHPLFFQPALLASFPPSFFRFFVSLFSHGSLVTNDKMSVPLLGSRTLRVSKRETPRRGITTHGDAFIHRAGYFTIPQRPSEGPQSYALGIFKLEPASIRALLPPDLRRPRWSRGAPDNTVFYASRNVRCPVFTMNRPRTRGRLFLWLLE